MVRADITGCKIGDNYVFWDTDDKEIIDTPDLHKLYMMLRNLGSSGTLGSIEIGNMDEYGISCVKIALPDFEFCNLVDESGKIQTYLEMASEFSKEIYSNPAGRTALLRSTIGGAIKLELHV